jgi:hypothetical protein
MSISSPPGDFRRMYHFIQTASMPSLTNCGVDNTTANRMATTLTNHGLNAFVTGMSLLSLKTRSKRRETGLIPISISGWFTICKNAM